MSAIVDFERIRRTVAGMESLTDEQITGILSVAKDAEAEEKSAREALKDRLATIVAPVPAILEQVPGKTSGAGNYGWSLSFTTEDGYWVSLNVNAPKGDDRHEKK
jgi:hypothetical protein